MSSNNPKNKSASKASAQSKPSASKNLASPSKEAIPPPNLGEGKGTPRRQSENAPASKKTGGATLKVSNSQAVIIPAGEKKRGKTFPVITLNSI